MNIFFTLLFLKIGNYLDVKIGLRYHEIKLLFHRSVFMLPNLKERFINTWKYGSYFFHSTLIGLVSGIFCGLSGCAFLAVTNQAYAYSKAFPWTIFFLPFAGGRSWELSLHNHMSQFLITDFFLSLAY